MFAHLMLFTLSDGAKIFRKDQAPAQRVYLKAREMCGKKDTETHKCAKL